MIEGEKLGDNVTLYLGDCLEVMRGMDDKSMDAVITDPPYGIDFKYSLHDDSSEGYGEWLWSVLEKCEELSNPGAPIFVWQAMPNVRKFSEWFPRDWRLFAACKNFVQIRPTQMQYSYDPVVVWWKDGGDPYSEGTLSRDFYVADTSPSRNTGLNNVQGHPCPRPLSQMVHVVNQWVRPGTVVFDPFMGSGTTGVACVQTGRKFIGIEIDPGYYEIAKKRIQQAQLQVRMDI